MNHDAKLERKRENLDRVLSEVAHTDEWTVDRILEDLQPAVYRAHPFRLEPWKPNEVQLMIAAGARRVDLTRGAGFRMFSTAREMFVALRRQVMLKMIQQAHEAELAEPGAPPTSGIVGTPEW